ncbi:MAG: GNAT family N-acetyltransferase [Fimbriimonadaceae bacterium]|nr:GNAT family N-acetyltransferase [Fimbriimonadaceae bacterium]
MRTIHPRTPQQWDEARRLLSRYAESIAETPCFDGLAEDLPRLRTRYSRPNGFVYLGYLDGECRGVVTLDLKSEPSVVRRLYVEPSARGRGLGRRLMEALIACSGGRPLRLETLEAMVEARALYRSMGFLETGREEGVTTMERPGLNRSA